MSSPPPQPEVIDLTDLPSEPDEDDNHTAGIPLEEIRPTLLDAIQTVPAQRLRELVTNLVLTLPEVEEALTNELVVIRKRTRDVASRWEICRNCEEEFDVGTRRTEGECRYHPGAYLISIRVFIRNDLMNTTGDLEVDYEAFVDWDPRCHGPEDTPENRRDYPENFRWNCCEEDGTARGCERDIHVPLEHKRRRT